MVKSIRSQRYLFVGSLTIGICCNCNNVVQLPKSICDTTLPTGIVAGKDYGVANSRDVILKINSCGVLTKWIRDISVVEYYHIGDSIKHCK